MGGGGGGGRLHTHTHTRTHTHLFIYLLMIAFNEAVLNVLATPSAALREQTNVFYVAFMQRREGKERVQLETKYNRSNQILQKSK